MYPVTFIVPLDVLVSVYGCKNVKSVKFWVPEIFGTERYSDGLHDHKICLPRQQL